MIDLDSLHDDFLNVDDHDAILYQLHHLVVPPPGLEHDEDLPELPDQDGLGSLYQMYTKSYLKFEDIMILTDPIHDVYDLIVCLYHCFESDVLHRAHHAALHDADTIYVVFDTLSNEVFLSLIFIRFGRNQSFSKKFSDFLG